MVKEIHNKIMTTLTDQEIAQQLLLGFRFAQPQSAKSLNHTGHCLNRGLAGLDDYTDYEYRA